jgi:hypothetical protein
MPDDKSLFGQIHNTLILESLPIVKVETQMEKTRGQWPGVSQASRPVTASSVWEITFKKMVAFASHYMCVEDVEFTKWKMGCP